LPNFSLTPNGVFTFEVKAKEKRAISVALKTAFADSFFRLSTTL
jgi:hypothetical protein